jgi:hypothetical protein
MPKSKHRRKGRSRPRAYQTVAPVKHADPSPRWIPMTGVGLLIGGVALILLGYLPVVADRVASWPPLGPNNFLILGFVVMIAGLVFLTRWK